jgi:peptide/nickel transport system permease protein
MPERESQELVSAQAGLAAAVAVESGPDLGEGLEPVRARGYWEQVWIRFSRDRVAVASGIFVIFLCLVAIIGGPIVATILGHGPNDIFFSGVDSETLLPVGPWTHVLDPETGGTTLFVLGADSLLGRDEFLRILYGARVSLEVAVLSTMGVMIVGVTLGTIAGYFRGWIDTVISRIIEVTMAFPALLFIIALAATIGNRLNDVTFGVFGEGVVTLILVFTVFGWFYPARIVRSSVLSLREKEFVEAARALGVSTPQQVVRHILPNAMGPIIVAGSIDVAAAILLESTLSFLGLGFPPDIPTWGRILFDAKDNLDFAPHWAIFPGTAIFLAVLSINFIGDGLRDALDPRKVL